MESSDAETGMVDCGVGTIVWVRRRNGSWWPGKILGPNELSASHLMSPRSGTPVKLLGREDASVDWYNLEKSKRVKPFRCGEFDDCIERAEASQGMPPKKREKYARREDAILHALELEKQLLEKKHGKSGGPSNGMSTKLLGGVGKDTTVPPEFSCDSGKHVNSKTDDKRKGVDGGSQVGVDDKSSVVRPRMRGLQDLGVSPVSFKYKFSSLAASNGSHKHAPDDGIGIRADPDSLSPENRPPVDSKTLLEKRKRSHEGHMEESLSKRRDRHRPLVQVLESSAKLPLIHSLQLHDDGGSASLLVLGKEQREIVDPTKEGNNAGVALKSDDSFDCDETLCDRVEISISNFERRDDAVPAGLSEENTTGSTEDTETDSSGTESLISDTCDAVTALSDEAEHIELIPKSFGRSEESMSDESAESLTVSKWQLKGKRNSRSLSNSHWKVGDTYNWEGNDGYYHDPVYGGRMLIDVEVQVQSGYQREHVPMISLMSKLNDKAIVGHPIPIETLEEASSETILHEFQTLQPWRTARRSAKTRAPRPPRLDEEEYAVDEERKPPSHKGRLKKPQRRSSLTCSQKIRRLSSIGGAHQQQQREEEEVVMKPVACIPVKLVFSRLHEELVARHQ